MTVRAPADLPHETGVPLYLHSLLHRVSRFHKVQLSPATCSFSPCAFIPGQLTATFCPGSTLLMKSWPKAVHFLQAFNQTTVSFLRDLSAPPKI